MRLELIKTRKNQMILSESHNFLKYLTNLTINIGLKSLTPNFSTRCTETWMVTLTG